MKKPPFRLWIGVMIFFSTFTNYMLRANMSVSIIAMVDRKSQNFVPYCKRTNGSATTNTTDPAIDEEKYQWDENQVGSIMAGYYYGYILSVIPGGILAESVGPSPVILWSSLGAGVVTALTPLSTNFGSTGVFLNRCATGFFGGVVYPAINVLIARWAPPSEKGRFLIAMMGNTVGVVFAFDLVGLVTFSYGWKWGFYAISIVMVIFCICFGILVADGPEKSRWASDEEKTFVLEAQRENLAKRMAIPPFEDIFRSGHFWALVAAQFGNLWGLNLMLMFMPKFVSEVIGYNLETSSYWASFPNFVRLLTSLMFAFLGDMISTKNIVSVTVIRKFFTIFSHLLPAVCFFLMETAGCDENLTLVLLTLSLAFNGAVVVSHLVNPLDLTPNFAGTTFGLMNFIGTTTGIIVPSVTGLLLETNDLNLFATTMIFVMAGMVYTFCGLVFIFFGTAAVQPWDEIEDEH